jgi:hypothetical protein
MESISDGLGACSHLTVVAGASPRRDLGVRTCRERGTDLARSFLIGRSCKEGFSSLRGSCFTEELGPGCANGARLSRSTWSTGSSPLSSRRLRLIGLSFKDSASDSEAEELSWSCGRPADRTRLFPTAAFLPVRLKRSLPLTTSSVAAGEGLDDRSRGIFVDFV